MIWLFLLLLAAVAALPFVIEHYRVKMSDGRRGSASGQFAELSQGVTHYHLTGPAEGPLVVCIHGLTTPSIVWSPLAKEMVDLGFRVLVYDLYGRGYSDRPAGTQDKALFNRQLVDLLTHLEIDAPFHLIGHSMGGAIATGFAATYPERVRRLALLTPAGMARIDASLIRFIRDRGIIGDWLMLAGYPRQLRNGIRAECEQYDVSAQISESQHNQLVFQGFVPAVLSSLRGLLRAPLEGEHMTLHRAKIPVLALWGGEDTVVSASAMGQLAAWNRDVIHEVVEDAGHGLPYTHTKEVLAHLTAFLPAPEGDDWGHDP
ncbi:alpha/beta hydrolase [Sulfitobacter sp. F26169L]|uniref:alpha/beta fold hydrolase n=1 Tax=Sulfitobacter sp. F26169L TaxID=2996015 RepID=UPI0022609333|nr:alpha/beta hydrolase [Sulfitobacter sp. F26169L]MCX7565711.1 alpha/beta hydrolase [Sulfitobacter sp. F26169L]